MGDFSAPGMQGFDRDDKYASTLNADNDKTLVMPTVRDVDAHMMPRDPSAPEITFPKGDVWATQVGGAHYKDFAIQPTEYIVKNKLNFVEGNIVKYVTRYKKKNGLEDLYKARHYLDILIDSLEKEVNGR